MATHRNNTEDASISFGGPLELRQPACSFRGLTGAKEKSCLYFLQSSGCREGIIRSNINIVQYDSASDSSSVPFWLRHIDFLDAENVLFDSPLTICRTQVDEYSKK